MTNEEKRNIYNNIQNLYNMDFTTWQEVLAMLYNLVSDIEQKFEAFEQKFEIMVGKEVTEAIKKLYESGKLAEIINQEVFKQLNDKIDNNYVNLIEIITDEISKLKKEQLYITDYAHLVSGTDWSPVIEALLRDNPVGEIIIPRGTYLFSKPIILGDEQCLTIEYGAIIRATQNMDMFIQRHGTDSILTREYNFYNSIKGGGVIDCDGKAKVGISLGGYRGYKINNITILNMLEYGIKSSCGNYAVELFVNDVRIEIHNNRTDINATGMLINSSDNHFTDIIMVDTLHGIECTDYSNRFFRCHHWLRDRIKGKDLGSISFNDTGAFNTYDTCYADTSNIGFLIGGGNTLINCEYFNSQHFNALNPIAIKFNKEITSILVIENFRVRGDGTVNVKKAIDGDINAYVRLLNCYSNHLVETGFPTIAKNYDNLYSYLESTGDIRAKVIRASNKIQSENYNFSETQWLHCNENDIVMINNYPLMVLVPVPKSYTSPGAYGQFAYDENYFYIYVVNVGWKRFEFGQPW